ADVGSEAVAGATIALRVMMFTMMPAWGLSNAAATLVGQNLGAGHPARAESAVWKIGLYNMVFLILVSVLYFLYHEQLIQLFTAAAATTTRTLINLFFFWLMQIPLSYYLAIHLDWEHSGVFWGVFISEASVGLFTLWLFTRGRWKTVQV